MKTYEFVFLYLSSWHVSDLEITRNCEDTWALQKHTIMQNGSTTGLVCLIGYVQLLLIASDARITSQSLNTEIKHHRKNGKTRLFRSEQSTLITRDLFTHQVNATFVVSWLLMYFLAFWWYTQLQTLEHKLLSQPSRNRYTPLETLDIICTIELLPLSTLNSWTGQRNLASRCDLKEHTRPGLMP